jgi:hypothetical protein
MTAAPPKAAERTWSAGGQKETFTSSENQIEFCLKMAVNKVRSACAIDTINFVAKWQGGAAC